MSKTINGVRTEYQYDRQDVVAELGDGAIGANYLRGVSIDGPFVRQAAGTEYYHLDALGNTLRLTDTAGAVMTSYAYEAFGKATTTIGASLNPFQYTGRENDGTGLYYYRARYYNPTLQRFISEDPLICGRPGSFPLVSVMREPQSTNAYSYVLNSPVDKTDPLGLTPDCSYYQKRCDEVGKGNWGDRAYYCDVAPWVCRNAGENCWSNTVRQCLQLFDRERWAKGGGRKDPSVDCYLLSSYEFCFQQGVFNCVSTMAQRMYLF